MRGRVISGGRSGSHGINGGINLLSQQKICPVWLQGNTQTASTLMEVKFVRLFVAERICQLFLICTGSYRWIFYRSPGQYGQHACVLNAPIYFAESGLIWDVGSKFHFGSRPVSISGGAPPITLLFSLSTAQSAKSIWIRVVLVAPVSSINTIVRYRFTCMSLNNRMQDLALKT